MNFTCMFTFIYFSHFVIINKSIDLFMFSKVILEISFENK